METNELATLGVLPERPTNRRRSALSRALRAVHLSEVFPEILAESGWRSTCGWEIVRSDDRSKRERAWRFAYDIFHKIGYEGERASKVRAMLQDALPESRTYAIESPTPLPAPLATISLIPDSPLGLPMDQECPEQTIGLRSSGCRLCEVARLAASETSGLGDSSKRKLVLELFRLAYLDARRQGATDLVISVIPRHARFYQHVLLFEVLGEARPYRSVGGTIGVPMRLNLETAEERYRTRYGTDAGSLYSFFVSAEGQKLSKWLGRSQPAMPREDLEYFFVEQSDLFANASAAEQTYLHHRHPALNWESLLHSETAAMPCL